MNNSIKNFASKLNVTQVISKKGLVSIKGGLGDPPPFGIVGKRVGGGDPPPFG